MSCPHGNPIGGCDICDEIDAAYEAGKRSALAEQPAQQEPVTWGVDWGQAGQIPCVSIIKRLPGGGIEVVAVEYAPYEYNPPAQRTWVGLTDEEREQHRNDWHSNIHDKEFRAIEAKLKEKNT